MLAPWLELPGVADQLGEFSDAAGMDLERLGTSADAEEIKDTAVTQPLLVAAGLISAGALGLEDSTEQVVAGHSVGELTAAGVAGAMTRGAAVRFAAHRGAAMAEACSATPTGMSAVLGGDPDDVVAAIESLGLTAANRNGAGQVVAAGALDALEKLAANPPDKAKVRPLQVAGAFHTPYMASAEESLRAFTATLDVRDPRPILLSNADGAGVEAGGDLIARLVRQVTLPVRWDLCLRTCADLNVSAAIELAPGGVLAGLAKRELKGVDLIAIKTPDDLDKARALVASGTQHGQGEHAPDLQVVVSPAKGVFTRADGLAEGSRVPNGTKLGVVRTNRAEHEVVSERAGVLAEWLREDGDIVPAGLPIARLDAAER